jgi:hypothetical protein
MQKFVSSPGRELKRSWKRMMTFPLIGPDENDAVTDDGGEYGLRAFCSRIYEYSSRETQ